VVGIDTSARPSGSPTWPLDVFAAQSADRRTMAVSLVNPTETPQDCELNLVGAQASGPARVYQLTAPPAGTTQAPSGPASMFSGPPATVAESSLPMAPQRVTLPPTSLTVYAFDVR
jgi:alpha-N-arabinofuranosidase